MATINADLFVDNAGNTLLYNQFGGAPAIPPMNGGDTLALRVFFFDRGSGAFPYSGARYPGAGVTVRLRASGNNTTYATANATSEIVPATGFATSTTQSYGAHQVEKQKAVLNSLPLTGNFKIIFPVMGNGGGLSLQRPTGTADIPFNASADTILAAIRTTKGYYRGTDGPYTYDEVLAQFIGSVGNDEGTPPIVTGDLTDLANGFTLQFGSLYGGSNFWRDQAQLTLSDAGIRYAFGWNVNLVLDGNGHTFGDLFLNGPSYLEVLLTPAGGIEEYAAQYEIASSSGIAGTPPPPPTPVGGGGTLVGDEFAGCWFDGDFSQAKPVAVMRTEHPIPQSPGARVYRQPFWQMRGSFAELALDSPCPYDPAAGLVEETDQRDVGGASLVEWERVWATVPPTRIEYDVINYVWQIMGTINGANALASFGITRRAKVTYQYFRTTNPASISLSRMPRVQLFAGLFYLFDGFTNLNAGTETIARDDTLERWMGNIWVRTHTTIVL
jgi:hypothetical protein